MNRRDERAGSITPDSIRHEEKFIADAMLGRLARWLRFLGFDTVFSPNITDRNLIRTAREENRTILTRDTQLIKIKGLESYLLIASEDPFQQLLETISAFGLTTFHLISRCVACNGMLEEVGDKAVLKDSVPEYVFLHYDLFRQCTNCGKIYWEGSHPKKFREEIRGILGDN